MAQACLTHYFTPKRSRHSSTVLANGEPIKSQKRKLKIEDENNENVCSSSLSSKKRRISKAPTPTLRNPHSSTRLQARQNQRTVTFRDVT